MAQPERSIFIPQREVTPRQEVDSNIAQQLDHYLSLRRQILGESRSPQEQSLLSRTYSEAIAIRNKRSEEIASPEVKLAIRNARNFLHGENTHRRAAKRIECSDGRLLPTLVLGVPDGHKKTIENPGAFIPGVVKDSNGQCTLVEGSPFKKLLKDVVERNDTVVQLVESHTGCAARQEKTKREKGYLPDDKGLRLDVEEKSQLAGVFSRYQKEVNDTLPDNETKKRIITIQTTYDPQTGFMYMGLERKTALESSAETGYTPEKLEELAHKKDIIGTQQLLEDTLDEGITIRELFDKKKIHDYSWETNYTQTAVQCWENLPAMADETSLLKHVTKRVQAIYPEADGEEIAYRAKFLAMNAYNAFHGDLHTQHNEDIIVISHGENGPYADHNAFTISDEGKPREKIISTIDLGEGLIRSNRIEGRVKNKSGMPLEKYTASPVPILLKSDVPTEMPQNEWQKLHLTLQEDREGKIPPEQQLIPQDWNTMNRDAFAIHVSRFAFSKEIKDALVKLHGDLRAFYSPSTTLHDRLLSRRLEVVPSIGDRDTGVKAVIPFVYKGYESTSA